MAAVPDCTGHNVPIYAATPAKLNRSIRSVHDPQAFATMIARWFEARRGSENGDCFPGSLASIKNVELANGDQVDYGGGV